MVSLFVTTGPLAGQRIQLDRELVVGREHGDITIDDPEISRRHARFHVSDGEPTVEDLGSLNGTLVNGVAIDRVTVLAAGDVVELGATRCEVIGEASGSSTARPIPTAAREPAVAEPSSRADPVPELTAAAHPDDPAPSPPAGVVLTHVGDRFVIGYAPSFCGIWERRSPAEPVQRFPRTDDGWADAWLLFSSWEPLVRPVPADG
jgi:predicted component of type VI protein secretion system